MDALLTSPARARSIGARLRRGASSSLRGAIVCFVGHCRFRVGLARACLILAQSRRANHCSFARSCPVLREKINCLAICGNQKWMSAFRLDASRRARGVSRARRSPSSDATHFERALDCNSRTMQPMLFVPTSNDGKGLRIFTCSCPQMRRFHGETLRCCTAATKSP